MKDEREKNLREVYQNLDESRREKMEKIAVGLLDVQMVVENDKQSALKKPEIKNDNRKDD
jgi:hypothetical protein